MAYNSPRISSEFVDCSLPMTFDQYNFCSYGCTYCFSFTFKTNNPSVEEAKITSVNDKKICSYMRGDEKILNNMWYKDFFEKKFILHWGGLADPFCGFEKKQGVGFNIIETAAEENYPVLFSTKGAIHKYKEHMAVFKNAKKRNFAFQFSIVVYDDELSQKVEPGCPTTSERLKSIEKLSKLGYYVILRFRPFIVGVSSVDYMKLMKSARDAGAKGVSTEFYALDARCSDPIRIRKLEKLIKEISGFDTKMMDYYKKLSPVERGTYYRLNRLVKERYIKNMYKFCLDNDMLFACSDPDYKELNFSPSCCGMPTKKLAKKLGIKLNKGLFNYTPNQLTGKIVEMRKAHWKGEPMQVKIDDVISTKEDTYLTEPGFSECHPKTFNLSHAARKSICYYDIFRSHWNTLYPYKYFHGKMAPCGNEDGNYIYKYVPSEYEERWIKEGIRLDK